MMSKFPIRRLTKINFRDVQALLRKAEMRVASLERTAEQKVNRSRDGQDMILVGYPDTDFEIRPVLDIFQNIWLDIRLGLKLISG